MLRSGWAGLRGFVLNIKNELIFLGIDVLGGIFAYLFDPFYLRANYPGLDDAVYFIVYVVIAIIVLFLLVFIFHAFKLQTKVADKKKGKFNRDKLKLAKGWLVNFPDSKYHKVNEEEYVFTLINNTGHNLKKCFVLLDQFYAKSNQTKGKWVLQGKDIFDKPFVWNRSDIPADGKINLENNDRASFVLVRVSDTPIYNVIEKRNERHKDFQLAFLGDDEHGLLTGWDHNLVFSIRALDEDGDGVLIKYSLYLKTHSSKGINDLKLKRIEAASPKKR